MEDSINEKWDSICRVMKEFDELYHKMAVHYHLSDSSLWVLYVLYQKPNGCAQKDLCVDWYMNKQTLNSAIRYLEKSKYITLDYAENNKKLKTIVLTTRGRQLAEATVKNILEIEHRAFRQIDKQELNTVVRFLKTQLGILKTETQKVIKELK